MKKRRKAALCALLCCALLIGCSPLKTLPDPEPEVTAAPSLSPAATPRPVPDEAPPGTAGEQKEKTDKDKEETVYIKAGADGKAREVTVETVLRCRGTDGTIVDRTRLTDIKNTEGDEDFRPGRNGSLTWENHGEDIHYEGKSRDPLPVGVKIRYTLNGRPIKPEDLAGKSGHLTIRFDYENRTQETREVSIYGGESKTIQTRVPFLAVSFAMLPKEVFSHVECKNGRLLSLGEQNAFLGFALPGLPDALTLSDNKLTEELDIPTYAELEADVTDFEMDFTATVFSNGLLEDLEQKDLNDLYDLAGEFDTLYDAAAQLAEGSEKLGDGMSAYVSGVNSALQTAKDLAADLPAVAAELETLSKEAGIQISGLAESVSTLDSVRATLSTISGELESLSGVLGDVSLSTEAIEAAANTIGLAKNAVGSATDAIGNAKDAVNLELDTVYGDLGEITIDISDAMRDQGLTDDQIDAINGELQRQIEEENGHISEMGNDLINDANSNINDAQEALNNAFGILTAAEEPMNEAMLALSAAQGAMTALAGTDPGVLNAAIQEIYGEINELKTITDTLYGILTSHGAIQSYLEKVEKMTEGLDGQIPEDLDLGAVLQSLMDAGTTLNKGLHKLEDGNAAFRDGIAELADAGGWKLRRLTRELDAMRAADLAYCNFGGIAEGQSGSVRFIIETDAIEK